MDMDETTDHPNIVPQSTYDALDRGVPPFTDYSKKPSSEEEEETPDANQMFLFEELADDFSWRDEWQGMPEFIQEDLSAKRTISIHFKTDEDVENFAYVISQKITPAQQSLWYPESSVWAGNKRYVDDNETENK